jgi:hypothetical protein
VIHEHDALELASAAIDFGLTGAEAERLREAVADCPVCAERASAYRRQMRLLADLPPLEPSFATRRRVMRAARTGRTVDTRTPMLLLAAALLLGALLAVAAAVGGVFDDRRPRELPRLDAANPSPSTIVASASQSAGPSPSAGPGLGKGPILQADSIADVVSSNLRIRSEPRVADDSIKYEPFLNGGDRLFVIAGPVNADDYDWYQVAAWRPSASSTAWPVGWVARADHDGTQWVQAATPSCPTAPSMDVVIAMHPYEALSCFGDRPLVVRAYIGGGTPTDGCQAGGTATSCVTGPVWLAGMNGPVGFLDAASAASTAGPGMLQLAVDPDGQGGSAGLPTGRMAVIEGAFDHPAASSCAGGGNTLAGPGLTNEEAVLRCRTRFVVSRTTPEKNFLVAEAPAVTTTSGLRVRSLPVVDETSEQYQPLLARGTRLFVLRGPVIGSGYDWYEVLAPGIKRQGGEPMIGWIAVGAKTGETWVEPIPLDCPSPNGLVSLADLARLGSGTIPGGGVTCFGDADITTSATLHVDCISPLPAPRPDWIASGSGATARMSDAGVSFVGQVDLAGGDGICGSPQDVRWNIEGHFDDPDSSACGTGSATDPAAILDRFRCRSTFVVTLTLR